MGIKVVLADGDTKYMSMLGRALLDSGYIICPAETSITAIKQITEYDVDACIVDVDLPGGIEEVLELCINLAKPVVAMGVSPLSLTDKSVELMYYGIPYVKKYNLSGEAKLDHIIARMNTLLKTLLIWSNDTGSHLGIITMLENKKYKVFTVENSADLLHTFLLSEPKNIIVYFPSLENMKELKVIRAIDNRLPIILVMDKSPIMKDDLYEDEFTRILTNDGISDFLDTL